MAGNQGLRHSVRRLNDLEKENTELESDNHKLDRESKGLHKEIARLKQAIEVCPHLQIPFQFRFNSVSIPFQFRFISVDSLTWSKPVY